MQKTYHGSCHCGAVQFEANLDLSKGTNRCNCTHCRKTRNWSAMTTPEGLWVTAGEEALQIYKVRPEYELESWFCRYCGVRLFGRGNLPEIGGPFASVRLAVLDDVSPEELIAAPITWSDGLNNAWWDAPAETRHL